MADEQTVIAYRPPGQVAAAFHKSTAFVRGIKGPVGSGKSSSCCIEIIKHSLKQTPHNGVRKARWAIIRNTYPELKSTTIKTWQMWVPDDLAPVKWDTPITCTMRIKDCGDGNALELEVVFIAVDTPDSIGKLRGLELTGVWLNECSELSKDILDKATERVGRYPPKSHGGGPVHPCVIMDTNPPDDDHWFYKMAEEERPESWEFFHQPGALVRIWDNEHVTYRPNPEAENVMNLGGGYDYYLRMVDGKTDDWVKIFVLGQYGTTADGKPVYPEYSDKLHVSPTKLQPMKGIPVYLGWDFGLTPACVVAQMSPKGQLLILDEFVAEDMGIRQFASDIVKPVLLTKYAGHRFESFGDPSGTSRKDTDERTCFQELLELGIATEPAETNDFVPRRESVAFYLTKLAAGQPAFLLDPDVKVLRKGFLGGYCYERVKVAGERYRDRPNKTNKHTHPHDALQYLCLAMRRGIQNVQARPVKRVSSRAWA